MKNSENITNNTTDNIQARYCKTDVSISFNFSKISNGSIIRLKNDSNRDWVCIHYSKCDMDYRLKHNKNNKNHTGYYLFGGLWYDGDPLTDKPYGKCLERLERGMFNNIESVVGHISVDFNEYRCSGRL